MDVIALAQQGLRNAVATLGTATSEEHLKRLFRIVPSVLFCFDGTPPDARLRRALEATLPNLQDGRRARFLFLPDGEDPTPWSAPRAPTPFAPAYSSTRNHWPTISSSN